jgi:hypothetical protein
MWKVKGEIDLKLGLEGFSVVIFSCIEDKERIFEEGFYFSNLAGLHLCYWTHIFSLETLDLVVFSTSCVLGQRNTRGVREYVRFFYKYFIGN